jgi:hypothetical protein
MADADVQGTHTIRNMRTKGHRSSHHLSAPSFIGLLQNVFMPGAVLVIVGGLILYKPQLRSRIDVEAIKGMVWGFIGIAPFLPLVVEGVA